jgi:hypothetical protein
MFSSAAPGVAALVGDLHADQYIRVHGGNEIPKTCQGVPVTGDIGHARTILILYSQEIAVGGGGERERREADMHYRNWTG